MFTRINLHLSTTLAHSPYGAEVIRLLIITENYTLSFVYVLSIIMITPVTWPTHTRMVVISFSNAPYYLMYNIIEYILSKLTKPFTLNVISNGKRKKRRTYLIDWIEIQKLQIFVLFSWKSEASRSLYCRCSNTTAGIIIISSTEFRRGQRARSGSVCTIIRSWCKWYFCINKKKKLKYAMISEGLRTAAVAVAEARVKSRRNLKAHRLSGTFYNLCPLYVRAR